MQFAIRAGVAGLAFAAVSVAGLTAMAANPATWVTGDNTKTCAEINWDYLFPNRYRVTNTDGTNLIVHNVGATNHVATLQIELMLAACQNHKPYVASITDPLRLPAPVADHIKVDF